MSRHLILQHPHIEQCDLSALQTLVAASPMRVNERVMRYSVADTLVLPDAVIDVLNQQQIDYALLPERHFAELGLIVSDMDSTLITIECIDEIAAGVGLKEQVAEITEQSMRGELDFEQSLRRRVALLKGLHEDVLQDVYDHVLQLSAGAEY